MAIQEANGGTKNNINIILVCATNFYFQQPVLDFIKEQEGNWLISHHSDTENVLNVIASNKKDIAYAIIEISARSTFAYRNFKRIIDALDKIPRLAVAENVDLSHFEKILSFGINGFINTKDTAISIALALSSIENQGFPISPTIAKLLIPNIKQKIIIENKEVSLTPQQQRILTLIYAGRSYTQIASDMGLSINTVHTYSRSLFKRLNVHSKTEAIHFAKTAGLLS
jgi:DNA-binding NarL/FixJ family response regulator